MKKNIIENRLSYNRVIVDKLSELINKYPYLRFGQLLVICGILQYNDNNEVVDPHYEESKETWNRMLNSKACFEQDITES